MTQEAHDPGGKVRIKLPPDVTGSAMFSACRRYRPLLIRQWGGTPGFALWVGMNPSTAAADVDDPTVKLEWTFTRNRLGLGAYVKTNVMDYRATNPKALLAEGIKPQSEDNVPTILAYARKADRVILAFGALPDIFRGYAGEIVSILRAEKIPLFCVGLTKDGSPRHPLRFLRRDGLLMPFPAGNYGSHAWRKIEPAKCDPSFLEQTQSSL